MASKQPFKFFDWKQKLTRFYIRLNKTISHKVLSKSRNALLLEFNPQPEYTSNFGDKLRKTLKKTWEIYDLNLNSQNYNTINQHNSKQIESQFANRQYDAIIVMPYSNQKTTKFYNIENQLFSTDLESYRKAIMVNILAYRLAHKYLTTSGVLILSNSQSDFAQVENKPKVLQTDMKNIIDAQISYMGVTVGDRDYTDLNSWSVIALSSELIKAQNEQNKLEDFAVQMYASWANGNNLPMPGSFALFKEESGKKKPFVQYL